MTHFQTLILAVIACALSVIALDTVFGSREARAGFGGNNLHPITGDMVMVLFYNDGDNCIYEYKTKAGGPARKISCITGLQ